MQERTEDQALADVQARLAGRFPELDQEVVAAAVRTAQAEMTGPIRDYVPLLVEHTARDRLAVRAHHQPLPTVPGA
ncbi:three-helix bundle dimerization domain-containing protein [Sinomonas susongensis]|uniref:three-helix bundle dimerization domain-containing protein n=1 Tax=Sinomonas susongensis TaxID=1324851 RepID=UPI00110A01DD|nr:hypothetical protein [Sinomonas susongensis]